MNKIISKTFNDLDKNWYTLNYKVKSILFVGMLATKFDREKVNEIITKLSPFIEKHGDDKRIILAKGLLFFSLLNQTENITDKCLKQAHSLTAQLDESFLEHLLAEYSQEMYRFISVQINVYLKIKEYKKTNEILGTVMQDYVIDQFSIYERMMLRFLEGFSYYVQGDMTKANQVFKEVDRYLRKNPEQYYYALFVIESSNADELFVKGEITNAMKLYHSSINRLKGRSTPELLKEIVDGVKTKL